MLSSTSHSENRHQQQKKACRTMPRIHGRVEGIAPNSLPSLHCRAKSLFATAQNYVISWEARIKPRRHRRERRYRQPRSRPSTSSSDLRKCTAEANAVTTSLLTAVCKLSLYLPGQVQSPSGCAARRVRDTAMDPQLPRRRRLSHSWLGLARTEPIEGTLTKHVSIMKVRRNEFSCFRTFTA